MCVCVCVCVYRSNKTQDKSLDKILYKMAINI